MATSHNNSVPFYWDEFAGSRRLTVRFPGLCSHTIKYEVLDNKLRLRGQKMVKPSKHEEFSIEVILPEDISINNIFKHNIQDTFVLIFLKRQQPKPDNIPTKSAQGSTYQAPVMGKIWKHAGKKVQAGALNKAEKETLVLETPNLNKADPQTINPSKVIDKENNTELQEKKDKGKPKDEETVDLSPLVIQGSPSQEEKCNTPDHVSLRGVQVQSKEKHGKHVTETDSLEALQSPEQRGNVEPSLAVKDVSKNECILQGRLKQKEPHKDVTSSRHDERKTVHLLDKIPRIKGQIGSGDHHVKNTNRNEDGQSTDDQPRFLKYTKKVLHRTNMIDFKEVLMDNKTVITTAFVAFTLGCAFTRLHQRVFSTSSPN